MHRGNGSSRRAGCTGNPGDKIRRLACRNGAVRANKSANASRRAEVSGQQFAQVRDAGLGQRLQVSPGDDVLYVMRLRIVDGSPMAIEEIRIPAALVPGIGVESFTSGALYRRLRDTYGIDPTDAVQTTAPTVTDATEARLLDVPLYSPALLFERTTRDRTGRIIEFTRSVYRGDRYRITTHLKLGPNSG